MAGLIDCIWDHFIQTKFLGAVTSDFSNKYISDFNQCVSMTHVALQHGVDVDQFYHQHPIYANPLFLLRFVTFSETVYEDMSISALLEHLLAAGYEMEEPNCLGQTVLLYAANVCRRRCLHFLKKLISLGANIHAIDKEGRGTLHQALDFGRGLVESYLNIFMRGALLLESEGERNRTFEYHYDPDVPLVDPDDVPSYPLGIKATHAYADYPEEFPDIDYTPGDESEPYDSADYGDDDDFCYVGDYDIDDFTIVKGIEDVETGLPSSRQKTRVRFKLLTLLEAGCDPNLVDKKAASPSDYAQMENLWPQWEWALTQSGYIYDEDKQLWIKDISLSDIVDFASAE
jgi:ankyrin repeat protein